MRDLHLSRALLIIGMAVWNPCDDDREDERFPYEEENEKEGEHWRHQMVD